MQLLLPLCAPPSFPRDAGRGAGYWGWEASIRLIFGVPVAWRCILDQKRLRDLIVKIIGDFAFGATSKLF